MSLKWQFCQPVRGDGRELKPQLLDFSEPNMVKKNLRDIARINRWFGGRALLRLLRKLVRPKDQFSVLDVGTPSGDMGKCICKHFRNPTVISTDHHSSHLRNASSPRLAANAFHLPFLPGAFDFMACSSVWHQFSDSEVVKLIVELRRSARRALIVLDLERHSVQCHFLPMTRRLFGWSTLTLHDGPISAAASFRPQKLAFLESGGLEHVRGSEPVARSGKTEAVAVEFA